jgi:hypothetical protein
MMWAEYSSKAYAYSSASQTSPVTNLQALIASNGGAIYNGEGVFKATCGIVFMSVPHRTNDWDALAQKMSALALGGADLEVVRWLNVNSKTLKNLMRNFLSLSEMIQYSYVCGSSGSSEHLRTNGEGRTSDIVRC